MEHPPLTRQRNAFNGGINNIASGPIKTEPKAASAAFPGVVGTTRTKNVIHSAIPDTPTIGSSV